MRFSFGKGPCTPCCPALLVAYYRFGAAQRRSPGPRLLALCDLPMYSGIHIAEEILGCRPSASRQAFAAPQAPIAWASYWSHSRRSCASPRPSAASSEDHVRRTDSGCVRWRDCHCHAVRRVETVPGHARLADQFAFLAPHQTQERHCTMLSSAGQWDAPRGHP